ncbi:MAG TPA: hypothetical protein VJS89_10625 [Gammaproteobacteria bacterium]|nr:hypothetical protein [Gammaproteobacteria bacterium]
MQTHRRFKFLNVLLFATMLSLPLTTMAGGDAAQNGSSQAQGSAEPAMQLGKVTVTGERQIIKALQLIKVALRRPESSDPKLANVVVCRITNQMGSHAQQVLTCGTNRDLSARRDTFQRAALSAIATCGDKCNIDPYPYYNGWNEVLANQPGGIVSMPVNGPAFRALLDKIPLPASAATTAPSAATRH